MLVARSAKPGRFRPELLFRPGSVAVLGAGTPAGAQVLANLRAGGFAGPILAAEAPADLASRLAAAPDLAVLGLEDAAVAPALAALAACGTRAAIVLGMPTGLGNLAHAHGVRVLGPGSFGIAVPAIGLNASRAHLPPRPGRVALVSQSAAICRAVLDWAEPNGVGFSHIIGVGGNEDLGFAAALDWLARDPGTGAILLEIRRLKNPRLFLSAARAAARLRPVVAMRAGGRLLDPTGAADAAFAAALRRCGVLSVTRLEDLFGAAETLTRARPARGEALAIATNAIGPAWLAADAALRDGLALATLGPATRAALDQAVPGALDPPVHQPDARTLTDLAYVGADAPDRLGAATAVLCAAQEVGGVLVVHAPSGPADAGAVATIAAAARAGRAPVVVAALGETTGAAHRRQFAEAGVPAFATPALAVRGFLHLVQDRRNRAAARELPPRAVLRVAPDQPAAAAAFARAQAEGRQGLTQDEAMTVLAAYHIAPVPGEPVPDAEAAVRAAAELGYPVVLKRRRAERPAEGGRGAIALDLRDADQVRDAVRVLERRSVAGSAPGFVVQRQVARARELRVRVGEDPVFGPTIAFGQGGSAAEILRDEAYDLPPLNLPLARALIARTRVAGTLGPLHDLPAANAEAVAETLVRASQLIVDFPAIAELDINPLLADAAGALVCDAWLRLRPPGQPPGRLAIAPYPAELAGAFNGRTETFLVRPIRPEDAEAHIAFFARLPPLDVRYRFFTALRELPPEQVVRLTSVDYEREVAFIAVREATGETVGVARLVREGDTGAAEFAIVLQPDARRQGLAEHLMHRLIDWGRSQGVTELVGEVLAENAPMLAFSRRLGFALRHLPEDATVVEARLALGASA